ncbi:MAG: rod shape-determining protein MreD [Lachnospiraceae bacterium]|nr:rod shape-determining protein MreD [Lachnospiraceae bacterium]
MRRFVVYAVSLFVLFLAQTTSFRVFLPLTDIRPNLLLVFAASFALMRGEQTGILLGFFSGLFIDIVFGDHLGFYAAFFMFLCFIVGEFRRILTPDRFVPAFCLITGADLLYGMMNYVFQFLLRSRFHFRFYLAHVILPEAALTLMAALLLYPLFFMIDEGLEAGERKKAKKFV